MLANNTVTPFVTAGDALTIISFDRSKEDVVRETSEDRSLNLALRRRRVRSEILRIPLDADARTKAFLTDVIAALAGRRLLILARDLPSFPQAAELVAELCELSSACYVVAIGEYDTSFVSAHALTSYLVCEDREHIEMLADALLLPIAG